MAVMDTRRVTDWSAMAPGTAEESPGSVLNGSPQLPSLLRKKGFLRIIGIPPYLPQSVS